MADDSRIQFWQTATLAAPLAALVATPVAASLMGGFHEALVGEAVSAATTFGILGTMCFPLGAYFFARIKLDGARATSSQSWPTVPGVVLSSRVERRDTEDDTLHSLVVSYSYKVGERTYLGDVVAFAPEWIPDKAEIEALARKYPAKAAVPVHVDPNDPEMAVLETTGELARQNGWRVWLCVGTPLAATLFIAVVNTLGR